jgi:pimeloyl-ACP methyl ester carboxylesterase
MTNRRSARRLPALLAGIGLLAGCAVPAGSASSASPSADQPTPSPTPAPTQVVDGPIAVTAARELNVQCYGEGSPTILLEAGGTTSDLSDWSDTFVLALARQTTTCRYSRAGGPGSSPVDGLLTRKVIVHDAFTLLDTLHAQYGVSGPYVLVGWSFGGSVILAEALEHPELTAGLVVLDTGFPVDFMKVCTTSGRSRRECQETYDEDEEAKSIEKDIVDRLHPLPDLPVAEVSAMILDDCFLHRGEDSVSYDASGTIVSAPDCDTLAEKLADKNLADWRQVGPQVKEYRVQATHNGLPSEAGPEITAIIEEMLAAAT